MSVGPPRIADHADRSLSAVRRRHERRGALDAIRAPRSASRRTSARRFAPPRRPIAAHARVNGA